MLLNKHNLVGFHHLTNECRRKLTFMSSFHIRSMHETKTEQTIKTQYNSSNYSDNWIRQTQHNLASHTPKKWKAGIAARGRTAAFRLLRAANPVFRLRFLPDELWCSSTCVLPALCHVATRPLGGVYKPLVERQSLVVSPLQWRQGEPSETRQAAEARVKPLPSAIIIIFG